MNTQEYLVSHGCAGDFGRFREVTPLECRRGDRVVVRSQRGLEMGTVLCDATEGHGQLLARTFLGELLRHANADDQTTAERLALRTQQFFEDARRLAAESNLPVELLDAEILLDGRHALVHHLRWADFNAGLFVHELSRRHDCEVTLYDLAMPTETPSEGGCGRPDCGKTSGAGGCTTCGTGGGCGSGCGSAAQAKELQTYFASLRREMDERHRLPLL